MELVGAGLSSIIWAATSILSWATTLSYWLAAFLVLGASRRLPAPVQERLENRSLLWLPAIGFAMIAATALPSFYVGRPPAGRTTASIYVVFWLSFVPSGVILMRRYGWELYGSGVTTGLKVALVLSILFHPRHIQATEDFRDAVLYKLQLHERDMMVTNAVHEGRKNVVVPRLTRLPATIHFEILVRTRITITINATRHTGTSIASSRTVKATRHKLSGNSGHGWVSDREVRAVDAMSDSRP